MAKALVLSPKSTSSDWLRPPVGEGGMYVSARKAAFASSSVLAQHPAQLTYLVRLSRHSFGHAKCATDPVVRLAGMSKVAACGRRSLDTEGHAKAEICRPSLPLGLIVLQGTPLWLELHDSTTERLALAAITSFLSAPKRALTEAGETPHVRRLERRHCVTAAWARTRKDLMHGC